MTCKYQQSVFVSFRLCALYRGHLNGGKRMGTTFPVLKIPGMIYMYMRETIEWRINIVATPRGSPTHFHQDDIVHVYEGRR